MTTPVHIALYQPDIAGNTGTILRTAACLGFSVHIIEPAGFDLSDRNLKRAGMDYVALAALTRHLDWEAFEHWLAAEAKSLTLLTTKSTTSYALHTYGHEEVLLFGSESSGVPAHVHNAAQTRLTIPMHAEARSLNLAVSVGIVAAHAIHQSA